MNTPTKLVQEYNRINPSKRIKPFNNNGEFTARFKQFNKSLLKEGKTETIAFNFKTEKDGKNYKVTNNRVNKGDIKIYNNKSNRLIDLKPSKGKSTFFTVDGKLRKKTSIEEQDLELKNDVLKVNEVKNKDRLDSRYLNNLFKEYNLDNITKRTTKVDSKRPKKTDFLEFTIDKDKFKGNEYDSSINKVLSFLNRIDRSNNNVVISDGTTYTTLRPKNISKIRQLLSVDIQGESLNMYDSDVSLVYKLFDSADNIFVSVRGKGKNKAGGGFFPYTHKLDKIDLTRYSIFQDVKKEHYENNCLLYALEKAGLKTTKIKTFVYNQTIPMCKLKQVAEELDIFITVSKMENKKDEEIRVRKSYYGDKTKPLIELAIVEQHYFLIEKTEYTKYSIENYFDICNEKDFNQIVNKEKRMRKDRFINSFQLIKLLVENKNKYLEPITKTNELYKTIYDKKITEFKDLEFDDLINTKINKYQEPKAPPDAVYYFDFEATTNSEKAIVRFHKPYCVFTDKHRNGFFGLNCGEKLLKDLVEIHGVEKGEDKPVIRLIAHNSTYDFRFLVKYLTVQNTIEKGNSLVNANCMYSHNNKTIKIQIRDSLKMINQPLKKFGKLFKLEQEKELMPYDLYTEENVETNLIDINECLKFVKEEEKEEYIKNCKKINCIYKVKNSDQEVIDILKYAGWYCYRDCIVLKEGYEKFSEMCKEAIKFDSKDYLTLASMSDNYLKFTGCYDGVYQLSGVPRDFIQRCIVGGRTMCKENKKQIRNIDYADYDSCSLYPSAMCRMKGFLKGIPKVISNKFEPEKYDGYFIKIKVLKVGRKLNFPLQSIMTEAGVRNFTNDLEGKEIYIDKIALEDFVKFQKVEYEFIQGYYYDDGHNNKINKVMTELYKNRRKYKDEGNDIQMVFKELMNSSYGKSCLKPIETDYIYKKEKDLNKYVNKYFNYIKEYTKVADSDVYKIKADKAIVKHFNNVHVGVEILSMSKSIMNEVMVLAEDLKIDITYQDTDSIHMPLKDVPLLEEKFKEKYHRELNGKNTGEFHVDFDMNGSVGEIISIKSIFLGKKCYIDKLQALIEDCEGVNGGFDLETGEIINSYVTDYHIRMKGVGEDCIIYKAEQEYDEDVFRIFEDLYNKEYTGSGSKEFNDFENKKGLQFNLTAVRPKFEMCKDMRIFTKDNFYRNLYFD